jgi:NAD(P)H-dependent FMN reductase
METERVLLICGSRKPAPGKSSPSAAREMLKAVRGGVIEAGAENDWLDLHDLDLPFFDGRGVGQYESPDLDRTWQAVQAARVLLFSVPAYWGGPAGGLKNLLDLLGGAAYDLPPETAPPLKGKIAALLVVGADELSAHCGLAAMQTVLLSMGAWVAPRAMVVGNPRKVRDLDGLLRRLREFGGYAAGLARVQEGVPA